MNNGTQNKIVKKLEYKKFNINIYKYSDGLFLTIAKKYIYRRPDGSVIDEDAIAMFPYLKEMKSLPKDAWNRSDTYSLTIRRFSIETSEEEIQKIIDYYTNPSNVREKVYFDDCEKRLD